MGNANNRRIGEIISLPRMKRVLVSGSSLTYEHFIASRYICIREASTGQRGILVKVLGRASGDYAKIVKGVPFWRDDDDITFYGAIYYGYPLPSAEEVKEVLGIVKGNESLLRQFEEARMHINPDSTFWVNKIRRSKLFFKKLQYLDGHDGQLYTANDNANNHYRISIVYFNKDGEIIW